MEFAKGTLGWYVQHSESPYYLDDIPTDLRDIEVSYHICYSDLLPNHYVYLDPQKFTQEEVDEIRKRLVRKPGDMTNYRVFLGRFLIQKEEEDLLTHYVHNISDDEIFILSYFTEHEMVDGMSSPFSKDNIAHDLTNFTPTTYLSIIITYARQIGYLSSDWNYFMVGYEMEFYKTWELISEGEELDQYREVQYHWYYLASPYDSDITRGDIQSIITNISDPEKLLALDRIAKFEDIKIIRAKRFSNRPAKITDFIEDQEFKRFNYSYTLKEYVEMITK